MERHGVPATTISSRLKLGWELADAVTVKPDRRFHPTHKPAVGSVRPCPRLAHHKTSGRAYCEWQMANKRHVRYFGKLGSQDAEQAYARFQLQWATRLVKNVPIAQGESLLVCELVEQWLAYREHGDDGEGGCRKHGKLTSEIHSQRAAMAYLLRLHGAALVDEFGPDQLREVRKVMIDARPERNGKPSALGLTRKTINGYQSRIVQMFGWGEGRKLVPATVWHELKAVGKLQKGKTVARDPAKKKPAPWADVKPVEAPKPVEIPNPENHPAVMVAVARHDALRTKLASARAERVRLEREVGAKPGESDDDLEARLLAHGLATDDVTKLREARRVEKVTAQAVELVTGDVQKAREVATRELTAIVREELFLPAARAAVKDWLDAVQRVETFRRLVDEIQGRGVGANTFCPFNGRVPLSLADRDGLAEFARELIGDGFTDAATVNGAFGSKIV